jgi:hypothetical protein
MIFETLQELKIPEGVVTQIADASGRILWSGGSKIVLEVAKITATTYASETEYANEQFILLDIYPKTNGTVKVTYGGIKKTITDTSGVASPNAQTVFFGTFNGVSDSVATPASGILTITGDCEQFGVGSYKEKSSASTSTNVKTNTKYCSCITNVTKWGKISSIPINAFYECSSLALTSLPSGITSIGSYAFYGCPNIALTSLPSGITSIGDYTFFYCAHINITQIPEGVESIGNRAFMMSVTKNGSGYADDVYNTPMHNGTIILPSTLKSIGSCAFAIDYDSAEDYFTSYLSEVRIYATTPPTASSYIFGNVGLGAGSSITLKRIIVPKGCVDVYKSASGWATDYIEIEEAT